MYQVGHITDFDEADPIFDSETKAVNHAIKLSVESESGYVTQPYGVWTSQRDGSELLYIVYGDQVYEHRRVVSKKPPITPPHLYPMCTCHVQSPYRGPEHSLVCPLHKFRFES